MGKVGLLTTTWAGYFEIFGMTEFKNAILEDARTVGEALKQRCDLAHPGLVADRSDVDRALSSFRNADIELLILCELGYTDSWIPLSVIENFERTPLLIWMYKPTRALPCDYEGMMRGGGVNGTVEITQTLRRMGRDFHFVLGDVSDADVLEEIQEYVKVAALVRRLRNARFAWLPHRFEIMPDTYDDEFRYTQQIGPRAIYLSVNEVVSMMATISHEEARNTVEEMKKHYEICGPTEDDLLRCAKMKKTLERIAEKYRLNGFAVIGLEELVNAAGINIEVGTENLDEKGIMVSTEGDLATVTAMWILNQLTDAPVQFTEFLNYDKDSNTVLMGHWGTSGIKMARNKQVILTLPHVKIERASKERHRGVALEYIAKPGRVTLLNLSCDPQGYKMIVFEGESLDMEPLSIRMPHAILRLDAPLKLFFQSLFSEGVKHHFALVHGDVKSMIQKLAKMLNIRCISL